MPPKVGVLAMQGDVQEHLAALVSAGADAVPVRDEADLESVEGLVLPGGESSVVGMLLERYGLMKPVKRRIEAGLPTFGTCAGLILLAREVEASPLPRIGGLDVTLRRNAFGRQIDSFETDLTIPCIGAATFRGVFIRAPQVVAAGPGVDVLASIDAGPVLVRQRHILGGAFHPELTNDPRIHAYFLTMVRP